MIKKAKINLIGGGFQHCKGTNAFELPKIIEWIIGEQSSNVSIHIDSSILYNIDQSKVNYGMLSESKTIIPDVYRKVCESSGYLKTKFKRIFTHDQELCLSSDIFDLIPPPAVPWIPTAQRKIYKKTKLLSMIASNKNLCKEHSYRLETVKKYKNKLDFFGRGTTNELQNKIDGLRDYYFSIVMENSTHDNCYTEKLTDCLSVGTIPIYYGPKSTYHHFNSNGIIDLKDFDNLKLSPELYYSKIKAVRENFEIASNAPFPEDYAYTQYIMEDLNDIL
tara:strand:+ start:1432 stop:2262 length:831 start_codon:yes stop_codon:yes gene_type:complete